LAFLSDSVKNSNETDSKLSGISSSSNSPDGKMKPIATLGSGQARRDIPEIYFFKNSLNQPLLTKSYVTTFPNYSISKNIPEAMTVNKVKISFTNSIK
uniref:Uncharacterized protein n=1 Tax=Parascaris equorum TaxID=6256 RepID=A0A914RWN0_PAREQ